MANELALIFRNIIVNSFGDFDYYDRVLYTPLAEPDSASHLNNSECFAYLEFVLLQYYSALQKPFDSSVVIFVWAIPI